jgi:hypothetical protein
LELKIAKAQLEELKKDAVEAMETQRKRYFFYCFCAYCLVILNLLVLDMLASYTWLRAGSKEIGWTWV